MKLWSYLELFRIIIYPHRSFNSIIYSQSIKIFHHTCRHYGFPRHSKLEYIVEFSAGIIKTNVSLVLGSISRFMLFCLRELNIVAF